MTVAMLWLWIIEKQAPYRVGGVDVAFELVARKETMAASTTTLGKRGRLVLSARRTTTPCIPSNSRPLRRA